MRGSKKGFSTSTLVKVAGIIIAALLFVVSWASIFVEIPQIKDWRIGILVSSILFFGFIVWSFIDQQNRIKALENENRKLKAEKDWVEVKLSLSANVKTETVKATLDAIVRETTACLAVINNEKMEITDCYATLEDAKYYRVPFFRPLPSYSDMRLQWKDVSSNGNECKITLPPKNKVPKYVNLWSNQYPVGFTFCQPSNKVDFYGVYPMTVRIDGKYNGKDIKPVYFNGYLYTEKVSTTNRNPDGTLSDIPIGIDPYDIIIFSEGDWTKDKRIPVPRPMKFSDEENKKPKRKPQTRRKKEKSSLVKTSHK